MANCLKKIVLNEMSENELIKEILSKHIIIFLVDAEKMRNLIEKNHKVKKIYKLALETRKRIILFSSPYNFRVDVEKEVLTLLEDMGETAEDALLIII